MTKLLPSAQATFDDPSWTYELTYDGYLLMAWVGETGPPRLKTRNGGDAAKWFPEVLKELEELPPGDHVLDGEVCVLDEYGRTDSDKLHASGMARRWKPGLEPVAYYVFDILVDRGVDVGHEPTRRRQARLERLMRGGPSSLLRVEGFVGEGRWLFEQAPGA